LTPRSYSKRGRLQAARASHSTATTRSSRLRARLRGLREPGAARSRRLRERGRRGASDLLPKISEDIEDEPFAR
jgi:hypothetical protein